MNLYKPIVNPEIYLPDLLMKKKTKNKKQNKQTKKNNQTKKPLSYNLPRRLTLLMMPYFPERDGRVF